MRQAIVLYKGEEAGLLIQHDDATFTFRYADRWMSDTSKPPISLTLPKVKQEYTSSYLFPFFYNMLSEGVNRKLQSIQHRIDERDDFGLLLAIAQEDTIGAVRIKPIPSV